MKRRMIMVICLAWLTIAPGFAQHTPTGFYIVIEGKNNCPNLAHTLTGDDTFCLPKDPIITESDFEAVGDIIIDKPHKEKRFDLRLSAAGFKTLTTLASRLPDSKVALVIGGHVSGIYESNGQIQNRTLIIHGGIDSHDIQWMHDKLKNKKP